MDWNHVIVTGGAGFIGSHIVDQLVDRAKKVTVIDIEKPQWKNAAAKYRQIDIRDEKLEAIFEKAKPDLVFHLAAHIHERESVRDPALSASHNIHGMLNVLEASRKYLKGRFVFASTNAVYGHQDAFPISEQAIPRPLTPYGISKLTGERYLNFYHSVHGLSYAALRLGNVYGPRQDNSTESGAIGIFGTKLMRGEQVYINNDGLTTRDYVFVDDVVRAFFNAAESDYVGVLNIGTSRETSTNSLFKIIADVVGAQASPEYREEVEDIVKRLGLDVTAAASQLGWKPEVSIEEGVEKTIEWYRENI